MSPKITYILSGIALLLLVSAGIAIIVTYTKTSSSQPAVTLVADDQRIAAIKDYLAYSEFIKPSFNGYIFTSIKELSHNSAQQEYTDYIWAYSQEYYKKGNVIASGINASGPIVVHMKPDGSEVINIELPANGSQHWNDIRKMFPAEILTNDIFSTNSPTYQEIMDEFAADVKQQAQDHFGVAVRFSSQTSATSSTPEATSSATSTLHIILDQTDWGNVTSPLTITGKAKGWYFEGSFPVKILDANGNVLDQEPAQAQSDWMSNDFVPFQVTLNFTSTTTSGTLVFEKDNPSGLPQNDEKYEVPVVFGTLQSQ